MDMNLSTYARVISNVPQETVLGPVMFCCILLMCNNINNGNSSTTNLQHKYIQHFYRHVIYKGTMTDLQWNNSYKVAL